MKSFKLIAAAVILGAAAAARAGEPDFDGRGGGSLLDGLREVPAAEAPLPQAPPAPSAGPVLDRGPMGVDPLRYFQDDYYRNVKDLERAARAARTGAKRGAGKLTIVDYGPDFRAFLAKAENADPETQLAAWLELEAKFPEGMANFLFNADGPELDAARRRMLPLFMKRLPPYREATLKLFDAARGRIEAAFAGFKTAFPDYSPDITVYILPSVFHFNACAWPGNIAFGPDFMAYLGETEKNFGINTAHEAFHTYSFSKIPGRLGTFASPLWLEGSAVYTSALLNEGVTETEALGDAVLGERCADPLFVGGLAAAYRPLLAKPRDGAEAEAISQAWYRYFASTPEKPSRAGYCLGLQVFKRLAAKTPIPELMTWPEEKFSLAEDAVLAELAAR